MILRRGKEVWGRLVYNYFNFRKVRKCWLQSFCSLQESCLRTSV